jgi:hypothetical protein
LQRQRGINGLQVDLISLDNAFSPSEAMDTNPDIRRGMANTPIFAVQKILNRNKVSQALKSALDTNATANFVAEV